MNVLVTGGCGFIGSHLVEELAKRGNIVTVVDDLSTGFLSNLNSIENNNSVDLHAFISICEEKKLPFPIAQKQFDVVYHLAAKRSVPLSFKEPQEFINVNITGTSNILEKYPDSRIVNISSSSAQYCLSPYGITKKTAELLTALHPNSVSLRLFNVFGERQADCGAIVPEFAKLMLAGKQPTIYGNGLQTRDFTYVKDVVNELIEYGQGKYKKLKGQVYDVGYGKSHTVESVFEKIANQTKFNDSPIYTKQRQGDIRFSQAYDIIDKPKYGFEKGLERTIKWIKETKPYEVNL